MAVLMIDNELLNWMPDVMDQIKAMVGPVKRRRSLKPRVSELVFDYPGFEFNEVVLARIYQSKQHKKTRKVVGIASTEKHFKSYK